MPRILKVKTNTYLMKHILCVKCGQEVKESKAWWNIIKIKMNCDKETHTVTKHFTKYSELWHNDIWDFKDPLRALYWPNIISIISFITHHDKLKAEKIKTFYLSPFIFYLTWRKKTVILYVQYQIIEL